MDSFTLSKFNILFHLYLYKSPTNLKNTTLFSFPELQYGSEGSILLEGNNQRVGNFCLRKGERL